MDNLTHTLVGVGMANMGLTKRFGLRALAILVLTSNLPDVDILFPLLGGRLAFLNRRMWTHSILSIVVLAALFALVWRLWDKKLSWRALCGLSLLGLAGHLFFDLVNSYGVVALFPFSFQRFEFSWVFIIDLILWGLLLLPVTVALFLPRGTDTRKLYMAGMAGVGLYVGICAGAKVWSLSALRQQAGREGLTPTFTYVFPEPFGPQRFRGVARVGNRAYIYWLKPFRGTAERRLDLISEEDSPAVQNARASYAGRRLAWFFKAPIWRAVPGTPYVDVFDVRFMPLRIKWRKPSFIYRLNEKGELISPKVFHGALKGSKPASN